MQLVMVKVGPGYVDLRVKVPLRLLLMTAGLGQCNMQCCRDVLQAWKAASLHAALETAQQYQRGYLSHRKKTFEFPSCTVFGALRCAGRDLLSLH